jgi:MipA family protein
MPSFRALGPSLLALTSCMVSPARAGEIAPVRPPGAPASASSSVADEPAPAAVKRNWDAAIGGVLVWAPDYAGSDSQRLRLGPGFYLRYGRVSIATRSGFRSAGDPGERAGLRIDLSPSDRLRLAVGLRYDAGRQESSSEALKGLGDVPSTVRIRTMASYRLGDGWSAGSAVLLDALGRGGGWQADISAGRQMRLGVDTSWSFGAALAFAGDRHMQTYFGVTEEQSARTGHPAYEPSWGLRDISAYVNARTELGSSWHAFYGANVSRLLGPAAASPLTKQPNAWGLNAGLVHRF